jgi:integrase
MTRPAPSIRVWDVCYRRGRGRPWYVRWSVNGQEKGPKTFPTEDEALDYQARLRSAARDGEKWDLNTGVPVSWNPASTLDVGSYCRLYWQLRTRGLKARSHAALAETFSRFLVASVPKRAERCPVSYAEISRWIQSSTESKNFRKADEWIKRWSPQMSSMDKKELERVRVPLLQSVNGTPLGANVVRRRFNDISALLSNAVSEGVLEANELKMPERPELKERSKPLSKVYPNMDEMLEVIRVVQNKQPSSRLYRAMTAVGVLAGCRPSEIVVLEVEDVVLPEDGWGSLTVQRARTGLKGWSDDPDEIGTPKTDGRSVRTIPITPLLVEELRQYIAAVGIEDGPLFRTRTGTLPDNWGRALKNATEKAVVRLMAPYDLRRFHGTWLAESGMPYNEAARRMGHSLDVFMRIYVGVTGDAELAGNAAIDRVLSVQPFQIKTYSERPKR